MKAEEYQAQKNKIEKYEELTNRITELEKKLSQAEWRNNKRVLLSTGAGDSEYCSVPSSLNVNPDLDFQVGLVTNFASTLAEELTKKIGELTAEREAL